MHRLKSIFLTPQWIGLLVALCAFSVYIKTLAPSVTFIDSGELATVACTLGIAHPTGYPLFTLLGWVFSRLPLGGEEIVRLNVMAAVFCAAGVFVFFQLVYFLLTVVAKPKEDSPAGPLIASAGSALVLAFSETYWSQATSVEVYSLHMLLVSLVLFSFMKANYHDSEPGGEQRGRQFSGTRWWMLFAFVLGLSFTNHMTTILLAPGLLYLYFVEQGAGKSSWKRIVRMGGPFVLGLSAYVYLPIRAAQGALMNWGNPVSLERLLWHLSGKQFRVWLFSSTEAAGKQLNYFVSSYPREFAYIGAVLGIAGMLALFARHRRLATGVVVLFLSCVFYSINYDIHDIDSYFLLAYVCTALWSGFAFLMAHTWIRRKISVRTAAVGGLVAVASLAPIGIHYKQNDESSNHLVEDYTKNMFDSVKPNALVISYQWDFWVSAAYYDQLVRGYRSDVAVVDKELLRRSWYYIQLERRFPWLIKGSREEVDAFNRELYKFEHELPYNPSIIQARYVEMISSFISKNITSRPVYVTQEIEPEFTTGFQRIPEGLAFRLVSDTLFHETVIPDYFVRPFERTGRLESMTKNLYVSSFSALATYYYQHGLASQAQTTAKVAAGVASKLGEPPVVSE